MGFTPESIAKSQATRAANRARKQALAAQASTVAAVDTGGEALPEGEIEVSRSLPTLAIDSLLAAAGFKSLKLFKLSVATLEDNLTATKVIFVRGERHEFPDGLVRVKAAVELLGLTGGKPSIQPQALRMKHIHEVYRADFTRSTLPRRQVNPAPPVSDGAVDDRLGG